MADINERDVAEEIQHGPSHCENSNFDEAPEIATSSTNDANRNELLDKLSLREWSPLTQLLSKIPKKAQKGLITLDLNFTCISVLPEFIAIGTNIGIVYWYNRKDDSLERLRLQRGNLAPISSINLLSSVDYMLAVGTNDGSVAILQIPKRSYEHEEVELKFRLQRKREIQIFEIAQNLHKSVITCLEWSTNAMKLFSGDMAGNIILTEIDYPQSQIQSYPLFDEKYEIVQLSYANAYLLISSTFRTIVYSLADKRSHKVGNQDRKTPGHFGGVFEGGFFNKNQNIYCSRQGLRLWVAETSGVVNKTIKFKNLMEESHPYIPVINPTAVKLRIPPKELQFGKLHMFMGKYVATSHKDVLLIFDPEKARIVGTCLELKSILSIGVHQNEIFILETGRNIIRISSEPDSSLLPKKSNSSDFEGIKKLPEIMTSSISDISHSLSFLKSKIKETSRGAIPKISPIISSIKTVVLEANSNIQDGLPPIIPLPDIPDILIEEKENEVFSVPKDRFEQISKESYEEVIFQSTEKRGKRKKKKLIRQELNSPVDLMSISSYSTNSEDPPSTSSNELGGERRKNSLESTHSENSTSTNTEGGESTGNPEICSLTGQTNTEVSNETIEQKEAILAKMLNWPILTRGNLNSDEELRDRTPSPVGRSDHESSTSSLMTLCQEDEDEELSDILTKADSGEADKELNCNIADRLSQILLLNNEESYHDIYNSNSKYYELRRNVETFPHHLLEGNSFSMSFGPPSGSSQLEEKSDKSSLSLLDTIESETRLSLEDLLPKEEPCRSDKEEIEREEEEENNMKYLLNENEEDVEVTATTGNHNWLQYNLPSTLSSFVCCDKYAVCIDSKHAVYYTSMGELSLTWVKTGYKANSMAISSSGEVVWRIKRGSLLTLRSPSPSGPFSTNDMDKKHWETIYENIAFASIDDKYGWVITTSGEVLVTVSLNLISFMPISTPWRLNSIHVWRNMVLGLTSDGKVIYRGGVSGESCPFGFDWKELREEFPHFTALAFGPKDSLWLADGQESLYFVPQLTAIAELSMSKLFKVETSDFTSGGNGQAHNGINAAWRSLTKLTESFRYDRLANLLQGKISILCASKSYIWLSHPGSNVIHLNKTAVKGYNWAKLSLEQPKDEGYWTNVFGGSIYNSQGYLWLQDSNGKICHTGVNGGKIKNIDLPNEKPITCLSLSPEALWMLSSEGQIFVRCNINRNDRVGSGWNKIPLSPLEDSLFVHLSCGSEVAWAVESSGNIYMRIGSLQPLCANDISPAWVPVEGKPSPPNAFFTKVYVDSSDRIVWALDNYKNIYAREAIFPDFPIGTRWVLVPGVEADRLCVSDTAVWALSPTGDIFRRNGISKTNFVGDFWQKIPGNAHILTTSLCDQIWALDESGSLLKLRKEILKFGQTSEMKTHSTLPSEDCEWEIL